MNKVELNKLVFEFATNEQIVSELLDEITNYYLLLYSDERQRFADINEVDLNDYEQDILLANYKIYIENLFMGLRDRGLVKLEELESELSDGITMLMIVFITKQFNRLHDTESSNVIQTAQLSVVEQLQKSNTDVRLTKTWISRNDDRTCKICQALHGMTIPVNENFLVNGQVVDLKDGTRFVYDYVDRTVAVAHPNDRCRIEFNVERD